MPLGMIASAEAQHGRDAVEQIGGKTLQRNLLFHLIDCAAEISFSCCLRAFCGMLPNSGTGFLGICIHAHIHTTVRINQRFQSKMDVSLMTELVCFENEAMRIKI